MRTSVVIKLILLFASLILVIWATIAVREGSMEGLFASLGGVDPTKQINLCPNRVHAFNFGDAKKIEEIHTRAEYKWIAFDPDARPLNYLEIEKWLGEHCYVNAKLLTENMEKFGAFETAVKMEYIDKTSISLMQNSANPNVYSWEGRLYESPEMTASLADLKQLAGW